MADQAPPTASAAEPRRKLGKYELVERFERGGMATVYKAYDPFLDRYVAIKQIAAHLGEDPKFVERFRHEAQVLAKLGSEAAHVVAIHELVEDEQGGLYIVMEYVEGRTLETFIPSAPISPAAAIKLLAQIASGLKSVHAKGIIHRDIKPLNVIITPQGRVKITDFGLAAHAGGSTSMSMGTTKYMAPELFKGGPIDSRADLYSLGFMMYELLCPVDRFNEIFEDVLRDERSEALRWMSWHADRDRTVPPLVEVNPKTPRRLSQLVERLMQKDPDARFFSAEEVLAELKSAFGRRRAGTTSIAKELAASTAAEVGAEPTVGLGAGAGPAAEKKPRSGDTARLPSPPNWKKRLILIGAGVLVVVVGLAVFLSLSGRAMKRAIQEANEASAQAAEQYRKGQYGQAAEKYRIVLDRVGRLQPGAEMVKNAQKMLAMAEAYVFRDQRKWGEAEKRLDEAFALGVENQVIYRFRNQMQALKDFYGLLDQADVEVKRAQFAQALKALEEADKLDPGRPEVEAKRVEVQYAKAMFEGDKALADAEFDQAETAFLRARSFRDTPEVAAKLTQLRADKPFHTAFKAGREAEKQRDWATAIDRYTEALKSRKDPQVEERVVECRYQQVMDKGRERETARRWQEARVQYEMAQGIKNTPEVQARIAAVQTEISAQDLLRQANRAQSIGDFDKAIDLLTQAIALKSDPMVQNRLTDLIFDRHMRNGRKYEAEKKWAEAEKEYRDAQLRKPTAPEPPAALAELQTRKRYHELLTRGDDLFKGKLFDQALDVYREAKKVRQEPEIDGKINDCLYEISMRAGKEREDARDYSGALPFYLAAQRYKATPEVQTAIDRVRPKASP